MKSGCLLELAKKDLILPNKKQLIRVAESSSTKFNACVSCLRLLICSNFFDKLKQQCRVIILIRLDCNISMTDLILWRDYGNRY